MNSKINMLCMSNLIPESGFDVLLSVYIKIIKKFPLVNLVIASDGPMFNSISRLIKEKGVSENVQLYKEFVSKDWARVLLSLSDLYINVEASTVSNNIDRVALKSNVKIICSHRNKEFVQHLNDNIYLVDPSDTNDTEDKLLQVIKLIIGNK